MTPDEHDKAFEEFYESITFYNPNPNNEDRIVFYHNLNKEDYKRLLRLAFFEGAKYGVAAVSKLTEDVFNHVQSR